MKTLSSTTGVVDKEQLIKFLYQKMNHKMNPEEFRVQIQQQVNTSLEKHKQCMLKEHHQKLKIKNLQDQSLKQREDLQHKISLKLLNSSKNKEENINKMVQDKIQKRKINEEYVGSKLKSIRSESLKESLKKIQTIQEKYEKSPFQPKKQPLNLFRSETQSRIRKRDQIYQENYHQMMGKLENKKIYELSNNQKMRNLYSKLSKEYIIKQKELEQEKIKKVSSNLQKINYARTRKDELIQEKTQKLMNLHKYEENSKQLRLRELKKNELLRRADLIQKNNKKMGQSASLNSLDLLKLEQDSMKKDKNTERMMEFNNLSRQIPSKKDVKKYIQQFMKQEHLVHANKN